jgi:rRNA maturation RNase YbeY
VKCHFTVFISSQARRFLKGLAHLRTDLHRTAHLVAEQELTSLERLILRIIIQSDDELLVLNKEILGHDYYTDIITFEIERNENMLECEIYISAERAKENAGRFHVDLLTELQRLVIHGLLHTAGYTDKYPAAKKRMQKRERFYLNAFTETEKR